KKSISLIINGIAKLHKFENKIKIQINDKANAPSIDSFGASFEAVHKLSKKPTVTPEIWILNIVQAVLKNLNLFLHLLSKS
ncbi:hypothetical protein OFC04_26670, partial [Escherichia coli]|nr:hypothetical protein [Escherichia coli]